ncbi:hypothetical protein V1T76_08485 [Roseibium sp. FZY0029]|uniref:hypothetical protein n=1 Tax=Roseibium sp. FZY0029 TaxID=3116647 RepID=UPI002EA24B13|nr:hypothetical protein [Roseibium sp. FZY0029]
MKPADADYGVTIDFERGTSDPVRVFEAMVKALGGFRDIDRLVLGAADPDLTPIMVLEDVEAASITSWVKNKVSAIDDMALKEFDLKQQVGKYAVKAKYLILKYLDERLVKEEAARLETLRDDLYKLSTENPTERKLPLPSRILLEDLTKPLDKIQDAKRLLGPSDRMIFKDEGGTHELDKSVTKKPSSYVKEIEKDSVGEMEMILTIRKPDLLGKSQWEFRHGKDSLSANIEDDFWLETLHKGEVSIVSGSGISCTVAYKYEYDERGNLISKHHDIVKVHRVIAPPSETQSDMPV